jgi:hypothetical protein
MDTGMSSFPQNPVSRAVWPWAQPAPVSAPHRPPAGKLLAQALLGYALAALAVWLLRRFGIGSWQVVAVVAATFTTGVLLLGFVAPALHARILRALVGLVVAVGNGLTAVLLPLVFFLLFLPIGQLRRMGGRDPLARPFPGPAGSLWQTRQVPAGPESYTRQF